MVLESHSNSKVFPPGLFGFTYVPVKAMADEVSGSNPIIGPVAGASAASLVASSIRVPLEFCKIIVDQRGCSSSAAFKSLMSHSKTASKFRALHRSAVLKSLPVDATLFLM